MANHALVIGCDRYWDDGSALDGAVRDALAVRRWLLDPERGAVPRQNLTLLLSPTGRSQVPPALAGVPEVTRPTVVEAMEALLMRAEGDEGTLYFYFAGHGLTAHGDGYDEPCLLPGDFRPGYREPALPVRAVVEQFATSSLATQFLIVDACRGIPTGRAFRAAGLSDRRPRDYSRREPDQYTLVATSAGDVAYETDGGEFTGALLRGLHGAGAAKRWDAAGERYVVRIRELFDYVRRDLDRAGVAQAPRLGGSHNEPNPVLVHVPDGAVDPATLTVTVTPAEAAACTTVTAYGATEHDDRVTRPPLPTPLPLRLRPRTYTVRVDSPDFVTRRGRMTVDLYDDAELEIAMERGLAHAAPSAFAARPGFAPVSLDEGSTVVGPDPSALLEAVDEAGRVRLGAGELTLDLAGRYRVRVVEPHAAGPWSIVEVTDRWPERFFPTPPAARLPLSPLSPLLTTGQGLVVVVIGWSDAVAANGVELPGPNAPVAVLPLPAGPAEVVLTGVLDRPLHVAAYAPGILLIDGPQVLCLPVDAGRAPHLRRGERVALRAWLDERAQLTRRAEPAMRAERAQRFAATGRIAEATAVLASGPAGPLGTALRGLLAARAGAAGADDVAAAAATLRREAPDLPDTAVLTALVRSYNTRRPVPPALLAVPVLSAALTAALHLYNRAGTKAPALLTRPAHKALPAQALTAWT